MKRADADGKPHQKLSSWAVLLLRATSSVR